MVAEASKAMEDYFKGIGKEVERAYSIASAAKSKGYDPDDTVLIPLAKNMAERVEGIISTIAPQIRGSGVVERIGELEKEYGAQDWRVAFRIALEVAQQKFCKFVDETKAMETGIRVGLAYVTVGVVASPIEGFVELRVQQRMDGKPYFCLMYSGPIRSAGGTAGAVSVLVADYVRKNMGYFPYDPTEKEIKRAYTELSDYHERVTNLQYYPSEEEVSFLSKNLPVQISGDASEKFEVSNYKDLPRIEANKIRNGFCLVTAECICLKAPKLWKQLSKWGHDMGMEQWDFIGDFVSLQKEIKARGEKAKEDSVKLRPDYTFIKDIVGGRPVITYPLREGGLRLRYGRCRTSGFSADALSPATMIVLDKFIAIGTQLKVERPGKATVAMSCDSIDGPIARLKNGDVLRLNTEAEAKAVANDIEEVIFLGDVLINYGDFVNRNHKLVPCGFNEDWWLQCLKKSSEEDYKLFKGRKVSFAEAVELSKKYNIPLHPSFIFFWNAVSPEGLRQIFLIAKNSKVKDEKIITPPLKLEEKRLFEIIGMPHKWVTDNQLVIAGDDARAFLFSLGGLTKDLVEGPNALCMVNSVSGAEIKDKLGTFIGARMGRPEKAKERKMTGTPHMLFPVGSEGGRLRCLQSALDTGRITAYFPMFFCRKCNRITVYRVCEVCEERTEQRFYCKACKEDKTEKECNKHGLCSPTKFQSINIQHYLDMALKKVGDRNCPDLVKGVRGLLNKEAGLPENLVKGILRAKYGIFVNKDGTVRYDMTEVPCTHFKPSEIGTSVERLRKLGYVKDCFGNELKDENQILELKPQDVILPACPESADEKADDLLFRCSKFIDECLVKLYGEKSYYELKTKEDLAGHLCVALSPHTSAGMVVRIVGFSNTQCFIAHPLLHSILRRDCDGDEAAVMLLMDTLLNFSRKFLPSTRGATQDAPLVLTSILIPKEVDDMVFDMDIVWEYPLDLYEAAEQYKSAADIKLPQVGSFLGTEKQYEGYGFTHDTKDINNGVRCSAYKSIPTMQEKVMGQMGIAEKLRAVDKDDVARLVIERHFLRDIKGNLRKFSMQQFRCVNCNEKFRRPPLAGRCTKCKGKIIFTISEGSIVKYLEPSISLAKKYNLPPYMRQSLELLKQRVESVFGKETEKQEGLSKWF